MWYSTSLPAVPLRWVLIRDPGEEFGTQALLCADLGAEPERIISWFVGRWQMETTFQGVRQRLGFETQGQWSEKAIGRTTPVAVEPFLPGHALRPPTNGASRLAHHPPSGLVRQISSDVHRCVGAGTQGSVDLHYFWRVALGPRDSKSSANVHGTLNGRGLLRGVMAKVQLEKLSDNSQARARRLTIRRLITA